MCLLRCCFLYYSNSLLRHFLLQLNFTKDQINRRNWLEKLKFCKIYADLNNLSEYIKKVKCTFVQPLRHPTGRTALRGSRGIALPLHDCGTRRGWGVSVRPRPLFTPGKDPVPIVQKAGWAPGPVWTGAENLVSTGILSSHRPARS
jgi:hypothetical protein